MEAADNAIELPTGVDVAVPVAVDSGGCLFNECRTIEANDTEVDGEEDADSGEGAAEAEVVAALRAPGCIDDG